MTRIVDLADGFSSATSPSTAVVIDDTTQSTDKDTGALIVEGGAGIEKNVNVGGALGVTGAVTVSDSTTSTTKDTGCVVVEGGVGIEENLNVGGNAVITGTLTVNGTTTTVNSSTLDVTDANVTVNNGGNQATADSADAGLTVEMSDATDALIHYDSTATSKWKCGESGATVEIADISSSQVITNKDVDGGTASNTNRVTLPKDTTTNLDLLTDKEGTVAYDTTLSSIVINDGSGWVEVGGTIIKTAYADLANYRDTKSATTSYKDWSFSTLSGDTSFVSLSTGDLQLDAGTYQLWIPVGSNAQNGQTSLRVYNSTDTASVEEFLNVAYSNADCDAFQTVPMEFTIAAQKVIKIQTKAQGTSGAELLSRVRIDQVS
jgi:hypothetical protein